MKLPWHLKCYLRVLLNVTPKHHFLEEILMRSFIVAAGLLTLIASGCQARNTTEEAPKSTPTSHAVEPVNAGHEKSEPLPFEVDRVADFDLPWRIAFLPDGRMLITEKTGGLWIVTQKGEKTQVQNVPDVVYGGQGGMLGVYLSPFYEKDHSIYLTYSEPENKGSGLALSRAQLAISGASAKLENLQVLWHDPAGGRGGQFGGAVAFSPDHKYLFLSVGERQRMTPAQNPNSPLGKTLRLTLNGKPAPGNPWAEKTGSKTLDIINPPRDTEKAKTAPTVYTYTYSVPNLTPSETWTLGHRNAYGLAFAPDGKLWSLEHGPRGGDELNLLQPGKNYGWPLVCYGKNYDGVPIPNPDTKPDLAKPALYWDPVIAPGGMVFYEGAMFPQWKGSLLISGLASKSLLRLTFDAQGNPKPADRWDLNRRLRDVAVAPDGAIWVIEDSQDGGLFRLTPLPE
jgi:glucose/arabinose dehydrogenase